MNFSEFLFKIENPQVYTGKEINVIKKDFNEKSINICLIFPDTYEIGMSHNGIKILYHFLNHLDTVNTERCFLPAKNSIDVFKKYHFPLFSLENRIPLKNFDLLSFSVLSELNYTNILQILDLAHIPLQTANRTHEDPLVAAGGISVANPEPLREFIDFFGIGDGETIFPEIIKILQAAKQKKNKSEILHHLDKIEGVYVPSLYSVRKSGRFYQPDLRKKIIKKRIFKSIDNSFPDENIIVPISKVVFDRLNVEIARGCQQTCRFCQAKSFYSPYRIKSLSNSVHFIQKALLKTGFEIFSLSSLSSGDYPYLRELLEFIPEIIPPCTSFSISSLRPATLSDQLLSTIAFFRRTGITLVPEAGTQRLRNVVNKSLSNRQIFRAVRIALNNNWRQIKLYFMIGLPTETVKDIKAIGEMVKDILNLARGKKKKIKIHLSISSFVPKPHTPLQWTKRENLDSLMEKIDIIKQDLKKYRQVHFDLHNPLRGIVETILSRGDFRVGKLLLEVYKKGEIFSAWDSSFHYSSWEQFIKNLGLAEFLSDINRDEPLPWDFIQLNYRKKHLMEEYKKSESAIPTQSCLEKECRECSGCIYPQKKINLPKRSLSGSSGKQNKNIHRNYNKVRIFYEKSNDFRYFSHLSLIKYIERLLRKSRIPFQCTEGFHPRMKASYPPPLPVYAQGFNEVLELYLDEEIGENDILNSLKQISGDFKFKKVLICNQRRSLTKDIQFIEYEFTHIDQTLERIKMHCLDSDEIISSGKGLFLKIDFTRQGQERFSRIYKILDPEKKKTFNLIRKKFIFKND